MYKTETAEPDYTDQNQTHCYRILYYAVYEL